MATYGPKFKMQRHQLTQKSEQDQELKKVPQDECRYDGDWRLGEVVCRGDT